MRQVQGSKRKRRPAGARGGAEARHRDALDFGRQASARVRARREGHAARRQPAPASGTVVRIAIPLGERRQLPGDERE